MAILLKLKKGTLFPPRNLLGLGRFHSNSEIEAPDLSAALCSFEEMLHTRPLPSSSRFTPLLDFVTKIKCFSCSIDCFKQMRAVGVPLNKHSASIVIKCYSHLYHTQSGLTVLACCLKHGIPLDHTWAYNTLIKGFIFEDKTHEAERVFKNLIRHRLCEPDLVTYNTMITGLCKIGDALTAVSLLRLMDGRGCKPNLDTYNIIIDSLCKDLMVDEAFKLIKRMDFPPDVVTYNSLVSALCQLDRWDDVSRMMKQMEDVSISPDIKTFNAIVDALCKRGSMEEAEAVVDIIYDNFHMHVDTATVNSLIFGHCLRGDMANARELLDEMHYSAATRPNADTYSILLLGYCRHVNPFKASLFYSLVTKPNKVARNILEMERRFFSMQSVHDLLDFPMDHPYVSLLQPGGNNTYEDALALFCFMEANRSNLNSHVKVYNILIDGALKCDKFDTARRLFHDLFVQGLQPDVQTYTIMIAGFCHRGLLRYANKLRFLMDKSIPDLNSNNNTRSFA
ncbi:putative tetratricopeptide-like helical domain superfamily [Helianthus annuus]|nr:putative tetratricopeptide-like helical domain superfamily [Helianthus annuus]